MPKYPTLEAEMAKRGYKKKVIANTANMSTRTFQEKRQGRSDFTWTQVCVIQDRFFPDIPKEVLFQSDKSYNPKVS